MSRSEDLLDTLHGIEDAVTGDAMSLNSVRTALEDHIGELKGQIDELVEHVSALEVENAALAEINEKCQICATCGSFRPNGVCGATGAFQGLDHSCKMWGI
jgi:regulator of replication initiation timing